MLVVTFGGAMNYKALFYVYDFSEVFAQGAVITIDDRP